MHPKIWGPSAWVLLFCAALEYPDEPTEENKRNMWVFITSLQPILPCNDCRKNFKKHLRQLPLSDEVLSSRESLLRWLIDQRNLVNEEKGSRIYSHDEAIVEIEKMVSEKTDGSDSQQKNVKKDNTYLPYFIIMILVAIILIMGFFLYQTII